MVESTNIVELFQNKSKQEIREAIKNLTALLETDVVIIYEKADNPQEDQLFLDPQLRLRVIVEKYFEMRAEHKETKQSELTQLQQMIVESEVQLQALN